MNDSGLKVSVRDSALSLIQSLPSTATWEEIQYHLYARQQIELGLADSDAGRLISTVEMRRRLESKKLEARRP